MKAFLSLSLMFLAIALMSCDFRSGTAKEEMDKFSGTPTPTVSLAPAPPPIDPADIVQVDPALDGDTLTVDGYAQKKTLTCNKFNRVTINGGENIVTING